MSGNVKDAVANAIDEKKTAVENKIDSARSFFAGGLTNLASKIAPDDNKKA